MLVELPAAMNLMEFTEWLHGQGYALPRQPDGRGVWVIERRLKPSWIERVARSVLSGARVVPFPSPPGPARRDPDDGGDVP